LYDSSAGGKPFHDAVPFAKRLIDNSPDRVRLAASLIPLYAPDPAPRQKLLVENPARLFKFN
jgi:2-pyrone-4,6-dicarboxylate lactonase